MSEWNEFHYSAWTVKMGSLVLQPLGKVAGCLLVEPADSVPGGALGDLPAQCSALGRCSPLLMCQLALEIQEADRERHTGYWSEGLGQGGWKRKNFTSPWIWRTAVPTAQLISLSAHMGAQSGWASSRAARSLPSALPVTCHLLYRPLAHTPFSPLQLHGLQQQSYTTFTPLFLINQICPYRDFNSSGFKNIIIAEN